MSEEIERRAEQWMHDFYFNAVRPGDTYNLIRDMLHAIHSCKRETYAAAASVARANRELPHGPTWTDACDAVADELRRRARKKTPSEAA